MPVIASITVEGIEETAAAFGRLPEEFFKVIDKELSEGIILISNTAKYKCPYQTGTLRRSIKYGKGTEPLEYICGTDVSYAEAVEYGTEAHEILPKNKPFLAWKVYEYYWSPKYQKMKKGRYAYLYSKHVWHPGTQPQPFLEPALFENENEINNNIYHAIINKIKSEGADVE